jgi:hypothetical protein
MTTSGSENFTLDLREIIEEAYARCGLVARSGEDFRSGRRSLDLLLIEFSNRGTNFWKLEEVSVALVAGTGTVDVDASALDVIDFYIRTGSGQGQTDLNVERISNATYFNLATKLTQGRPTQVWVEKQRDNPVLNLWPVPDQAYTLVYWQLARIEDSGDPANLNTDVPWRFLPAVVAGLAWKIAEKMVPQRLQEKKALFEEAWSEAEASDRDRTSVYFRPDLHAYRR